MSSTFQYPEAFDTSLSGNFSTESCPKFFDTFLTDDSFIKCYPMSFYLENSQSYIALVRKDGIAGVQKVLSASCSSDIDHCQKLMMDYAGELLSDSNCGKDYNDSNPLVTEAYQDFIAYTMIREATCLPLSLNSTTTKSKNKNTINDSTSIVTANSTTVSSNSTSSNLTMATYCYTDALFNTLDVADAYLYLLPFGLSYPNSSQPSCSTCTQKVLSFFHHYTGNASYQISYTYDDAAVLVNNKCGANYVNATGNPLPSSKSSKKNAAGRPVFSMYYAVLLILFASFII